MFNLANKRAAAFTPVRRRFSVTRVHSDGIVVG